MSAFRLLLFSGVIAAFVSSASAAGHSVDVAVYGATPAGIAAAVGAAREKKSVVLIEPTAHVGGMITGGLSRTDVGKPEVIGGFALEFFQRAARAYHGTDQAAVADKWYSEPKVAERAFNELLKEAGVTTVLNERLDLSLGVIKDATRITSIRTESGKTFAARVFIDASYEGDLMARAGVSYIVGRESREKYDEPLAGYYPMPVRPRTPEVMASECPCLGGKGPHYIHGTPAKIPALDDAGRPIFGVELPPAGLKPGDADDRTQSYNFRVIVTRDPGNRVPFPRPQGYDDSRYEMVFRLLKVYPDLRFSRLFHIGPVPGGKYDLNAAGPFSTDYAGANTAYPDGDYATRERIVRDHANHIQGLLWFLENDPRLPQRLRDEANQWGLPRDEFADNGNWPYQLYVREGRRMVGAYVLTQKDEQTQVAKPDSIAMGSFVIDSHIVRRIVAEDGTIADEGAFPDAHARPYQIPYRVLTPVKTECVNLLVPVCVSASHVAYCSIRMEPQYMMMGHAAGLAAAMAINGASGVQDIDVPALQEKLKSQNAVLGLAPTGLELSELAGIVVDDEEATLTGDWTVSSGGSGGVNGAYRHDGNADKGTKTARYEIRVPADGKYEVRLSYAPFVNRATNVPIKIEHAGGSAATTINERRPPPVERHFASVGVFEFKAAVPAVVTISTANTDGYVAVDAVQLLPQKN